MTSITTNKTTSVRNSQEFLNQLGIKVNLEEILVEEFKLGLPHELNTGH